MWQRTIGWALPAGMLAAVLLSGCAASPAGSPGSPDADTPPSTETEPDFSTWDLPPGKDVTAWGCEEEWLTFASIDGFFELTVRNDLVGSTSLSGVEGAADVDFNSPAICVFDSHLAEAPEVGTSRTYVFDDGMPHDLGAEFEARGWDGYFNFSTGRYEGTYSPSDAVDDLRGVHIRTSVNADGSGGMRGDLYVISLNYGLVAELDG